MSGEVRQRRTGAATRGGGNAAGPESEGDGTVEPEVAVRGARFGFWQSLSVFLLFLILSIAGLTVYLNFVPLHIHSCAIYVPFKIRAMTHAFNSLYYYGQRETFSALYTELTAAIYSDALNYQAPIVRINHVTAGKHLLMVGGTRTPVALSRAQQLGVKLTIIDDVSAYRWVHDKTSDKLVFLPVKDLNKVSVTSPDAVLQAIKKVMADGGVPGTKEEEKKPPITFDGIFTLVEDHGPLTSYLGEGLGLKVSSYQAASTARSKIAVREAMKAAGLKVPRFAAVNSEDDVAAAAKAVGFPAFLKPVYGVQATFAAKVSDEDELIDTLRDFQARIDPDHHPIYHYGRQMILESLMKGSEVQLELVLLDGEVVAHSFSSEYSERRDVLSFPPALPSKAQDELLELATDTVKAIKLTHGLVHIELFYDSELGAQVVEVNNRLTRGFLGQKFFHQLLFGQPIIDYYGSIFTTALGEVPLWYTRKEPLLHIAVGLDEPSSDWWHVDPKDAPNRGWERQGSCALFVGYNASHALEQARSAAAARHAEGPEYIERKKQEDLNLIIWQLMILVASVVSSMRLFFIGIY